MKHRLLLHPLLVGALSVVPALYVYARWPHVPALVAIHFNGEGTPNRWVPREVLWAPAWWPVLAFVLLTWFPQVRGAWFWRSDRQRQLRALVVAVLTLVAMAFVYKSIRFGKGPTAPLPTAERR